jgi:hypothetical protein
MLFEWLEGTYFGTKPIEQWFTEETFREKEEHLQKSNPGNVGRTLVL